jgi:hypothetical protein
VSDASREGLAVDRVSIPQEVWRAGLVRERLNDLANGPGRGGVFGHVDVEEFAAVMPQDDENEEQVGGDRGDKEEVDGDDVSGMRGEKGAGQVGAGRGDVRCRYLATVRSATA